jgi:sulfur carrier protein ThiS/GNAT superfamily N-acetyltransferase
MRVTVEVVGEETHEVRVDDDATYGDLLAPLDVSPHEVSVLIDGRPVPEDERVDADHVRVLRLIKGGSGPDRASRSTHADPRSRANAYTILTAPPTAVDAVVSILDAAMLATDRERLRASVERGTTLLAVPTAEVDDGAWTGDRALGALVRDGERVVAVAVRRRRRGQGIGTALVERAAADAGRLVAEFDADVRPFYESLGFEVVALDDGRYRGDR